MTIPCSDRQTDAVGAALDCELPAGHEGVHEAHTTPDTIVTWTDTPHASGGCPGCETCDLATHLADERTAHEAHRTAVSEALGLVPGAGWDAILDCAGKTREAAKERAAALQDARDVLARAGYPTDSNGWLILAPTIRKVTDEVKLLRGNSEVDRREASGQRTALATTLKRGPGADWYAVHAAAAEFVRRAVEAEATVSRVREIAGRLAAYAAAFQDVLDDTDRDPWARTIRAGLDELRAALDGTGDVEPEATCPGCGHTVPGEGCGCPPPQPTTPRPLVISIELDDATLAAAIRRALTHKTPHAPV